MALSLSGNWLRLFKSNMPSIICERSFMYFSIPSLLPSCAVCALCDCVTEVDVRGACGDGKGDKRRMKIEVKDVCVKGRREREVWNKIMNKREKDSAREGYRMHCDVYYTEIFLV